MEQLSNAMHAATADLPPTSIDLDRIIAGDRRRHHLRFQVGAVAGVAALGAVTMMVPAVFAGHQGGRTSAAGPHGTCPVMVFPSDSAVPVPMASASAMPSYPAASGLSGAPDGSGPPSIGAASQSNVPQPIEDCAFAAARLTADLKRMLHHDAPDLPIRIEDGSFLAFPGGDRGYNGVAVIGSGAAAWRLNVLITPAEPDSTKCAYEPGDCTTDPDGTVVDTYPGKTYTGTLTDAMALVQHADGTRVALSLDSAQWSSAGSAPTPRTDLPLTPGQLGDIGRGLTLYP